MEITLLSNIDSSTTTKNCVSTIIGAFLGSIYVNFAPVIFRKSKP